MHFRPLLLFHAAVIITIVLSLTWILSPVLLVLAEDVSKNAITRDEIACADRAIAQEWKNTSEPAFRRMPRIIHQVYLGWDDIPMPESWKPRQQSCIDLHKDWEYMFWDYDSAHGLLSDHYPWFLDTWLGYKYHIQRADSIRYFLLFHYGGIYVDLDNGCQRTLDPLLTFSAWMPTTSNKIGLTNHVMGSEKHHPYLQLIISSLQAYDHNWLMPYMTIMNSAGPHMASFVWETYKSRAPHPEPIRILSVAAYEGQEWSFFNKASGSSWCRWDTAIFRWLGLRLNYVVLLCFAGVCVILTLLWLKLWKVVMKRRAVATWKKTDGSHKRCEDGKESMHKASADSAV